jgi:hypothetical protein
LRLVAVALAAVVAVSAAFSFAPQPVPAAPPPIRVEGDWVETERGQNGLVVVPFPSVELGQPNPGVSSTTDAQVDDLVSDDSPDLVASPDEPAADPADSADSLDDSADSVEASADSPDDD